MTHAVFLWYSYPMIKVKTIHEEVILIPTIFPDGTSQIWKLPNPEILTRKEYVITWNFESEREIYDIYSFHTLLHENRERDDLPTVHLRMPYLPFGRQDKPVSNNTTFNLRVFARLINNLGFKSVATVDAHNPIVASEFFQLGFKNISVDKIHSELISSYNPTYIVFPDKGAQDRYKNLSHFSTIFCEKVRDQATGQITGVNVDFPQFTTLRPTDKLLIIDDLCDGGATFIAVAKALRENTMPNIRIALFVTHGIFSKGRKHLLDNGIDEIYTTNSLLHNKDGFSV